VTAFPLDRLVLVRHAMPEIDPDLPANRWQLSAAGRDAAQAMHAHLPADGYLVASDEPKAIQTLRDMSGNFDIPSNPGFAEVRRRQRWTTDEEYRAVARSYVDGTRHPGWEGHDDLVARFESALEYHAAQAAAAARPLIVGTHGMALTLWLASRGLIGATSPTDFWETLCFPEFIDVDLIAGRASVRSVG
jgi:broad specificity phosphatase PhoE